MSLKAFHIIFALVVGAFLVAFGVWCIQRFQINGSIGFLMTGSVSILLGVLSVFYLKWFLRKLKGIGFILVPLALFGSTITEACPVCLGNPNHPMARAANNGVLFLLTLTVAVLIPFAATFIYWAIRARRLAKLGN